MVDFEALAHDVVRALGDAWQYISARAHDIAKAFGAAWQYISAVLGAIAASIKHNSHWIWSCLAQIWHGLLFFFFWAAMIVGILIAFFVVCQGLYYVGVSIRRSRRRRLREDRQRQPLLRTHHPARYMPVVRVPPAPRDAVDRAVRISWLPDPPAHGSALFQPTRYECKVICI